MEFVGKWQNNIFEEAKAKLLVQSKTKHKNFIKGTHKTASHGKTKGHYNTCDTVHDEEKMFLRSSQLQIGYD